MHWPNGRIPYVFKPDIAPDQQRVFRRCVRAWQRVANVRFVPTTEDFFHHSPEPNYLLVQQNNLEFYELVKDVNYSWIGMCGGMQPMSIHSWDNFVVVHELGHTLGFIHEQMRTDRDDFVSLNWDQINGFTRINFDIETNSVRRTDYDYDSIMHYHDESFKDSWKNGKTMVATQNPAKSATMGQNNNYPPHPEEEILGGIGKVTAMLSDGDRLAIGLEYGKPTNFRGFVNLISGYGMEGVTATLVATGSNSDEAAFIDLLEATTEVSVKTNSLGEFNFRGIPSGSFKVQISKPGFSFTNNGEAAVVGGSGESMVRAFFATSTETVPPEVSISAPRPSPQAYAGIPTLTGNASDTGAAGLKDIQLALDSGDCWWNWHMPGYGEPGVELVESINIHVYTTAGGTWTIPSSKLNGLPDGVHHLQVRARDYSDNVSEWVPVNFTVDRVKPDLSLNPTETSFFDIETLGIGGTVADTLDPAPTVTFVIKEKNASSPHRYWTGTGWTTDSGEARTQLPTTVEEGYWKPLSVQMLPSRSQLRAGEYEISAKALDSAGNTRDSMVITRTRTPLDTTFPEVEFIPSFDGNRYEEHVMPSLSGIALDPESHIQGVRLYFMRFVPGATPAQNLIKYWNGEEWTDDEGHLEVTYDPVTLAWTAPGQGYRMPVGAAELPDGTYKVQATAFNREVPQLTKLIDATFFIGAAPPDVEITAPTHNGFVKAGWRIEGTATDHSNTGFDNDRVTFTLRRLSQYWDGTEWTNSAVELHAAIKEDGTWTYPGTEYGATLPTGEFMFDVRAFATDRNGNLSPTVAGGLTGNNDITFSVDTTPPTCVIVSPTTGTIITAPPLEAATFNGTATDGSGQPGVTLYLKRLADSYYWNGSSWVPTNEQAGMPGVFETPLASTWAFKKGFPCLSEHEWGMRNGSYELIAVAQDAAGNQTPKSVTLVIDYHPVWLRPQDALARVLPQQAPPIQADAVAMVEKHSFTPWQEGMPGNNGYLYPLGFGTDSQGNYYVTNRVVQGSHETGNFPSYHGIIQRLGTNGWRRQRTGYYLPTNPGPNDTITHYEQWSGDTSGYQISAAEAGIYYVDPQVSKTDAAGNTYVGFNLSGYSPYDLYGVGLLSSVMVVKFSPAGAVLYRKILPGSPDLQTPAGWYPKSSLTHLDVLADGSVSVAFGSGYGYSFEGLTGVYRLSATGVIQGALKLGRQADYDHGVPSIQSVPELSAVDAAGNAYVITRETTEGAAYSSQFLRKISANGTVLATCETSLCKAPEYWLDLAAGTDGSVFVLSNFDLSATDRRSCVTKYDGALNLVWRAFGPAGALDPSPSLSEGQRSRFHVGSHGITVVHQALGNYYSEWGLEHSLVSRFSLAGNLLWSRAFANPEPVSRDYVSEMKVTSVGDVLLIGGFGTDTGIAQTVYGKFSNAGDLQFIKPLDEAQYLQQVHLLPNDRLALMIHYTGSNASANGIERVVELDNPASVKIDVILDGPLPKDRTVLAGDRLELSVINRGSTGSYQWYLEDEVGNPQAIPGATSDKLVFESIPLTAAGLYSCVVTRGSDIATSRTAVVTVLQPVTLPIALDDANRTWTTGGDVPWVGFAPAPTHDGVDAAASGDVGQNETSWIETTVTGPATISYWWKSTIQFNGDYSLTDNGVSIAYTGYSPNWSLVTRNLGPGVHVLRWTFERYLGLSFNEYEKAWLDTFTVSTPVPLATGLDANGLTFTTGGAAGWTGVTPTPSHDGVDSGVSGDIGDSEESWVQTTVTGPGTISFWWKVSSETSWDFLRFYVNGSIGVGSITGESDWTYVTVPISGAGTHTLKWSYQKDEMGDRGSDAGWVDQVVFTSGTGSGIAPSFVTQPMSQLGIVGGIVSWLPTVAGSPTITYQWRKGAANTVINGATFPAFGFGNPKTTDVNVYSLKITNSSGFATSTPAYLGLATRAPFTVSVNEGAILSLTAAATVPAGATISSYLWKANNAAMVNGTVDGVKIEGATTKALKITGMKTGNAGGYTCMMTMSTPGGGMVTGTNGNTLVTVVQKPVVTPFALPNFKVSQSIDFVIPTTRGATKFTVTGLPPGVVANAATGRLTGKPTTASPLVKGVAKPYQVKVIASNAAGASLPVTVPWTIVPMDTRAIGTFNALVDRNLGLNGVAGALTGLGGTLKITTTATGSVSGSLKLGALAAHTLTDALDTPAMTGNPTLVIPIVRTAPLPNLTLTLAIDLATGELTGNVSDGANEASIHGWRATVSAAYAGLHNAGLFIDPTLASDPLYPQGSGYATLAVSATGVVTWGGKLADGPAITGSFPVGPLGQVPLQAMLYTNGGSVQGWVTINAANHFVDGAPGLSWYKAPLPSKNTTRSYKAGIPLHNLTVTGGPYIAKNASLYAMLNLIAPPLNAKAEVSAGGLLAPVSQSFTITAPNTVVVPANAVTLKLTMASATGVITGSFNQPGLTPTTPRKADMFGLVVPRLARGAGFFLLPEKAAPPATTATTTRIQSGKVEIGKF